MSAALSSPDAWWSVLESAAEDLFHGPAAADDPRLGELVAHWSAGRPALHPGQVVIVGCCSDEGVRRNGGRVGAAAAPDAIRKRLYRLVVWPELTSFGPDRAPILDLGNIAGGSDLDNTQTALGLVVAEVLAAGAIPVVLGGGHEIAYGHYQGYARAGLPCGILNVDAHLDVRPYDRGGHSGSPFRQAHEHPTHPLGPGRYVAFGVQRHSVSSRHCQYVEERGGRIVWTEAVASEADGLEQFHSQLDWLARDGLSIYLTVDADAFRQADVPGVSAPNPVGLPGELWPRLAAVAGSDRRVASIELGEVNPAADRDDQTARWAAVGLWSFLRVALGRSVPRPGGGSL